MNVLVATHDPVHPIQGGGGLRTLRCAQEFARRGHHVTIIAPTDGTAMVEGLPTEWLHAPRKQRSQLLSSLKFNVRMLRKYLRFIRRTDLVWVHNTIAAACVPFLRVLFRFHFVLDVTDIHAEYFADYEKNWLLRWIAPVVLWFEYAILRCADRVIVVTEVMKRRVIERGVKPDRVTVVYDGCDPTTYSAQKEAGSERRIIHLGLVDRQHGVDCLIQAIPGVIARHPDARFLIIGGGRELDNVRRLAEHLKVNSSCTFTGQLPSVEARAYLSRAAIGVIPRPDNLSNRLVTTLKIYEYWASGTAVVSSRLAGVAEVARHGENSLLYDPGNPSSLSQALCALLDDRPMLQRLQAGGVDSARRYRWDELSGQIVDFSLTGV